MQLLDGFGFKIGSVLFIRIDSWKRQFFQGYFKDLRIDCKLLSFVGFCSTSITVRFSTESK